MRDGKQAVSVLPTGSPALVSLDLENSGDEPLSLTWLPDGDGEAIDAMVLFRLVTVPLTLNDAMLRGFLSFGANYSTTTLGLKTPIACAGLRLPPAVIAFSFSACSWESCGCYSYGDCH